MYTHTILSSQSKYQICYHPHVFLCPFAICLFYLCLSLHFLEFCKNGVVLFFVCLFFFGLACFTQHNDIEIHPCCGMYLYLFTHLLLNSVPLQEHTTICLFVHLLMGICIVSNLICYN